VMSNTRRDILRLLEELSAACPEIRMGQLMANLSHIARGPSAESIWDMEDEELLAAARKFLEDLRARHASVA
jgi:hypothetical protein